MKHAAAHERMTLCVWCFKPANKDNAIDHKFYEYIRNCQPHYLCDKCWVEYKAGRRSVQ
jgi:hypothetical protein